MFSQFVTATQYMLEILEHALTSLRRKEMTIGLKDTIPGLESIKENKNL